MTWRDERQKTNVCVRLCELALLEPNALGQGSRLLYELAWALWDGRRGPDAGELFDHLGWQNRGTTAALAVAVLQGPDSVDRWLASTSALVNGGATAEVELS